MSHFNETCHSKDYEKKQQQKNKNFTAKSQYLNLKAPSNNVKLQSGKTLTTQIYFVLSTQPIRFLFDETRYQVDKKNK